MPLSVPIERVHRHAISPNAMSILFYKTGIAARLDFPDNRSSGTLYTDKLNQFARVMLESSGYAQRTLKTSH